MVFGWEGEGERKVVGPTSFLSSPFKIQSLQIGVKSEKNIWTKLPPPLINVFFFYLLFLCNSGLLFLFFFFFSFDFSFVTLAFCFCFCFFPFFWFCQVVGSSSFPSFSFLIFIFIIIFLRKHFWMISYAIFWNIHFYLYTFFFESIM